jgi:5'-3' exonuclease
MAAFKDKILEPNKNVLVVDAMNLAFRWKHRGKLDFELEYIRTVESLAQSYECSNIIITADAGSSKMRKDEYPEYKENRKERFKDQTAKEKEEMEKFFEEYERTCQSLAERFLVLRYKQVEADDLAAYITKKREEFGIDDIWMISSDRDWDLLVNDNVSRFSTVTRKETTVLNWDEFFDFPQEEYISYKVLTGDSGDNITGVSGVGPKKASELIKTYGSAFDVYDALPIDSKYKYIQTLNESGDLILRNYKLMDLLSYCEEAIECPGHSLEEIDDRIRSYLGEG